MDVFKTLLIGLGSTGTEICTEVARRIEWELGSWEKAPWVQFLCIETDAGQATPLASDFLALTISPDDYQRVLDQPHQYDNTLALTQWADTDTLRQLDSREVSAGAGNIRMVGRLAFLWERNFTHLKRVLTNKLAGLRDLTEPEAQEQLGTMPDGSSPDITFAGQGRIRVIVTGTLCGGTCSGIAADFGYFLRSLISEEDKSIAIFTLPHPQRSPALEAKADRHKRNAYTALLELNHYSLTALPAPRDRYPDGTYRPEGIPWDFLFVVMPRDASMESIEQLNYAVADRIFLNIFVHMADPFARGVDVTSQPDTRNRARVFSTFGLASLEFPARRVVDACAKRLLHRTFQKWNVAALDDTETQRILQEMRLTWEDLRAALLQQEGGYSLHHRLQQQVGRIVQAARRDVRRAWEELQRLRSALQDVPAQGGADDLSPGLVPNHIRARRRAVAESVAAGIRDWVRNNILDYRCGPARCSALMKACMERVAELSSAQASDFQHEVQRVDALLSELTDYHNDPWLGLTLLKGKALREPLAHLRAALDEELSARIDALVAEALSDYGEPAAPGLTRRLERVIRRWDLRLSNLTNRVARAIAELKNEEERDARHLPPVNGIALFEKETGASGTVREEYERWLKKKAGDPALELGEAEELIAPQVLAAWTNLQAAIDTADHESSWLDEQWQVASQTTTPLPDTDQQQLLRKAREYFLDLRNEDCLKRWARRPAAEAEAREVARKAAAFLNVDRHLDATGRHIDSRRMSFLPASEYSSRFKDAIASEWTEADERELPDNLRAVLLAEWYKFPLSVAPEITGPNGLCTAQCEDFPTFHSRTDIAWVGITDEEAEAILEAETLVAIGVLTGVLKPAKGHLVYEKVGTVTPVGQAPTIQLPQHFYRAVHALAQSPPDRRSLRAALESFLAGLPGADAQQRALSFVKHVHERWSAGEGRYIDGWPDPAELGKILCRYYGGDPHLQAALMEYYQPDQAERERLYRRQGDPLPDGRKAAKNGYYCLKCGGPIGETEQEAARNGWTCQWDPEHYFGPLQLE